MSLTIGKVLDIGLEQLGDHNISASATTLSCALTAIDAVQTFISAGINPALFCMGAFTGVFTTFGLYNFVTGHTAPRNDAEAYEMFSKLGRTFYSLIVGKLPTPLMRSSLAHSYFSSYSLIVGALPTPLMRISSLAHSCFSSSLVLGFRCGALLPHAYRHMRYFRTGA